MTTLLPVLVEPTELPDADRGAVSLQEGREGYFWVRGSEMVYEVFLQGDTGRCECPGHRYRGRCAHLQAVRLYRWQQRVCPICEGKGRQWPRPGSGVTWVQRDGTRNEGPFDLPCCEGTGLRSIYEQHPTGYIAGEFADACCPQPAQPRPEERR